MFNWIHAAHLCRLNNFEGLKHDNPFATEMTGLLGTESGHYSVEKADLVFLLGTDFPYTAWDPKNSPLGMI